MVCGKVFEGVLCCGVGVLFMVGVEFVVEVLNEWCVDVLIEKGFDGLYCIGWVFGDLLCYVEFGFFESFCVCELVE